MSANDKITFVDKKKILKELTDKQLKSINMQQYNVTLIMQPI